MKKGIRIALYFFAVLMVIILMAVIYLTTVLPNVGPPPDIDVELTDVRIERGRYLANHVMLCMDCHAVRDFTHFSGPPIPETIGAGGERFDQNMGLPGVFIAQNITPIGLGDWTDGEIFRMITTGVNKDGNAAFPLMPFMNYGTMAEEDILSVIAYLRSLDPVGVKQEPSKADFPVNLIMNTMPVEANLSPMPSRDNIVEYGRYMINAAACGECHTRREGPAIVGEPYAGGSEFILPDGSTVRSMNITPHETGIGSWTREAFVNRFKAYADSAYTPHLVGDGEFQTAMPWLMYGDMETEDLEAIYEYLRTVPPVEQTIVRFTPAE